MLVRHDPVTLYANGIRYLEKAPLMYWSMAASYTVFGVHDWSARLPLAIYTLALILSVFVGGRIFFDSSVAGFYAGLVLLTSFGVFIYTRIMIPDIMVCLWLTVAMLFFWRSLNGSSPTRATAWEFAAACALNVLTKGLIGIVFPLAIVILFLWFTRNLGHLRRWHPWSSILIFLAIALPWHVAAGIANPAMGRPVGTTPTQGNVRGFFWFYFVNEHLLRYLNRRVPRDYGTVPLILFWGLLAVWLAPWIAYVFNALAEVPWRGLLKRTPLSQQKQALLLLALWPASVMLFFSFSTRQEYYALPALPPLALMIGAWLAEEECEWKNKTGLGRRRVAGLRIAIVFMILGVCGAGAAFFFAWHGQPPAAGADLASLLSQNPDDYVLSLGHFLDLSGRAMGFFRVPLALTAIALLAGSVANFLFRRKEHLRFANCSLAAATVVFLVAAHMALVTFSPVLSSRVLAEAIAAELRPDDIVEIHGEYEAGSTLGFYLERQVRLLNGRSSDLWYGSFFPDAPPIFDDDASFRALWGGPRRVFLWTETDDLPMIPGRSYVLAQSGGKEILTNRKP
jgi:4-amino-4-deoxy-L-arabinose transferase-like glycosyltransferase